MQAPYSGVSRAEGMGFSFVGQVTSGPVGRSQYCMRLRFTRHVLKTRAKWMKGVCSTGRGSTCPGRVFLIVRASRGIDPLSISARRRVFTLAAKLGYGRGSFLKLQPDASLHTWPWLQRRSAVKTHCMQPSLQPSPCADSHLCVSLCCVIN